MTKKMIDTVFLSNISIKHKKEVKKDNIGVSSTSDLIEDRLYVKQPPRLLGIEKIGVLDSRVKDYSRRYYKAEGSFGRPNRLKIDCVAKNGKVFNTVNLQPDDVEIIDINPRVYLEDRHLGINQLLLIIDQINKSKNGYSIMFSPDTIEGTEEVVYDILSRLSVYKNGYWGVNLLNLRVKDLAYIVKKGPKDRVLNFITDLQNIAIILDDDFKDDNFTANMANSKPKFNVLFLIRQNKDVPFTIASQIINSSTSHIIVCETQIVNLMNSNQRYIELVTESQPARPVLGLPHELFYIIEPVDNICKTKLGTRISYKDGRIKELRTPTEKPTIIIYDNDAKINTQLMEGKYYRTLLLNSPTDLPYVMVVKLKELVKK